MTVRLFARSPTRIEIEKVRTPIELPPDKTNYPKKTSRKDIDETNSESEKNKLATDVKEERNTVRIFEKDKNRGAPVATNHRLEGAEKVGLSRKQRIDYFPP